MTRSMLAIALALPLAACHSEKVPSQDHAPQTAALDPGAALAWRPAVETPPAGWKGPVFALSHDYPSAAPKPPTGGYPWLAFDPKTQSAQYMQAVLAYARADLEAVDWDPTKLAAPNWFHAPWMSTGDASGSGREFIHGMTRERSSRAGELSPTQTNGFIPNYAVGLYNDVGGYTFGRVWADPAKPDWKGGKANFGDGTVGIKLLFTKADPAVPGDGVPYLHGSKEWQANIAPFGSSDRQPATLRLLQVDIAIRDARETTTGWLFGTFAYDGDAEGAGPFDRLRPVGLMWGDSPGFLPADFAAGKLPPQQWLNAGIATFQHYGWAHRINGPVDNPQSSCMSCHGRSAAFPLPKNVSMVPPSNATDAQRLAYFENVLAGQTPFPNATSLDYSLQMGVAMEAWNAWFTKPSGVTALGATDAERAPRISREEDPARR